MNIKARTILIVAILALCSSCSNFMAKWPPAVDPLKGWNSWSPDDEVLWPAMFSSPARPPTHSPLDKRIKDNYQSYLQKHEPGYFSESPSFYEDGTGQHAVKIRIGRDDDYTIYIFIYDKHNVRTKIMRFADGGYAS
jgi:hypothetical protein